VYIGIHHNNNIQAKHNMKWFQHQSAAHTDAKLKKVLMKFGFEGYGLYWYCIESICHNLEPRLTFELEEDSEILAHIGNMDSRTVEDAILYMVNQGLFTQDNGVIACHKIARHLGDNLTRNIDLKGIIKAEKDSVKVSLSQTVSDSLRLSQQEERRGEEKTGEEKKVIKNAATAAPSKRFVPPNIIQLQTYCEEKGFTFDPEGFLDYWKSVGWKRGRTPMKCWKSTARNWARNEKKAGYNGVKKSSKATSISDDLTDRSWA
jgi:hypothetical protein